MTTFIDMIEAKGLDASFLLFVGLLFLLTLLAALVVRGVFKFTIAKRDRRIATLIKDCRHVEDQLEAERKPILYIKDRASDPECSAMALKRKSYFTLGDYEEPELADRYEMAAAFLRDPTQLRDLLVVLETSEGAFYLSLWDIPTGGPEELNLKATFDPIHFGREVEILDCFIACDGFRLVDVQANGVMQPGDVLHTSYKLSGELA